MNNKDDIIILFHEIEGEIQKLSSLLKQGELIHASTSTLPIAEIGEDGKDTVFSEVEEITLERRYGADALSWYLSTLMFQKKSSTYSNIAGRRTVGTVHVTGPEDYQQSIQDKVIIINQKKTKLKDDVMAFYPTYADRTKFYRNHFPDVIMLTVFRHIPISNQDVNRMAFSWLNKGYGEQPITEEQVKKIIKARNKAKAINNQELKMADLVAMDESRLSAANPNHLYILKPTKINPRVEIDYVEGKRTPVRATIPILLTQSSPLKSYHELADFKGVDLLRKTCGKKTSTRVPIIYEYGIFEDKKSVR
ncbi:DNA replication terminus site-binding protein [Vibrio anguillarum]|uniref:DNA replication terminus site-binding protein n=1 Tax=Vibrio anguillarum TaxID=55601 RepID=A0A7U6FS51_VIBAN|nr:DNA replication terminus site-binding protein [Vibrio anguillarum]AZS26322.1 hypothetical protein DYL72_15550 [Vibrio anguillarum]MBF4374467.1 hypothetical protein [Vibrio anguillarum]